MAETLRLRQERVAISGLTAAGKTTLSLRLADAHGLEYISGSAILRAALGIRTANWTPAVDSQRTNLALERAVDQAVLDRFTKSRQGVFDTWSLPWKATGSENIWIESDFDSRIRKCMVSYMERGQPLSHSECRDLVTAKDLKSREVMLQNWGFDIFDDRSPFDIILDATELIPQISIHCAQVGADLLYRAALRALRDRWVANQNLDLPRAADTEDVSRLILRIRK